MKKVFLILFILFFCSSCCQPKQYNVHLKNVPPMHYTYKNELNSNIQFHSYEYVDIPGQTDGSQFLLTYDDYIEYHNTYIKDENYHYNEEFFETNSVFVNRYIFYSYAHWEEPLVMYGVNNVFASKSKVTLEIYKSQRAPFYLNNKDNFLFLGFKDSKENKSKKHDYKIVFNFYYVDKGHIVG